MIRNELKMSIPIIAMTAHSLVGEQQKCFDIGMNAYVAKPFKQYELLEAIQDVIKKQRASTDQSQEDTSSKVSLEEKWVSIDFTYLDELSGGDADFKKEMMELFIKNVPIDLQELAQAIQEKNQALIKKSAHHMKSSLAMFQLAKGIQFLEATEQQSAGEFMDSQLPKNFQDFQTYIQSVLLSLKNLL